jgi:fatty acid desaturase
MRQALHIAIGIAFWVVLAALWALLAVDGRASGAAFRDTGVMLAALMGVVLAVTIWWIHHNVGIYRRKGARAGRPENPPRTDEDRLGRQVAWGLSGGAPAALLQRHLVVEVADDLKTYRREA